MTHAAQTLRHLELRDQLEASVNSLSRAHQGTAIPRATLPGVTPKSPGLYSHLPLRPVEFTYEALDADTDWGIEAWRWNVAAKNYRRWAA